MAVVAVIAKGTLCSGISQITTQYAHITTRHGVIELYGAKAVRSGRGMVALSLSPIGLITRNRYVAVSWACLFLVVGFALVISIHWMPK